MLQSVLSGLSSSGFRIPIFLVLKVTLNYFGRKYHLKYHVSHTLITPTVQYVVQCTEYVIVESLTHKLQRCTVRDTVQQSEIRGVLTDVTKTKSVGTVR